MPEALEAAIALQLLCPQIPLIFMGEEGASRTPFQFFTDHHGELAEAVREGRRREFASFLRAKPGSRTTGSTRRQAAARLDRNAAQHSGGARLSVRVEADIAESRARLRERGKLANGFHRDGAPPFFPGCPAAPANWRSKVASRSDRAGRRTCAPSCRRSEPGLSPSARR
jgi:1,4-alpha-glucan branching enzyme